MIFVGFLISFGLSCVLFSCEGQVYPPSNQNMIVVLPGSTARLKWTFTGDPSRAALAWYFTRRRDGSKEEEIASKFRNNPAIIENSSLPGVAVESSSTLVLKNVDERYNGKYRLDVLVTGGGGKAEVELYIAAKPNPSINCSDPITVNEGDDLTCVCQDEDGNPPANLTWFDKDGNQIGNTIYRENILTLTNVTKQHSGRYTCKAQSYTLEGEKSFELIVRPNFKPNQTEVIFTMNPAIFRGSVTVMCSSNGVPEPSYTIMHNDSITVSNKTKYTIPEVKWSDAGAYKCIARNKLGSDSASKNLTVIVTPTIAVSCSSPTTLNKGDEFTCMCRSKYDNPPADVTWYKGNKRIVAGKEEAVLRFSNVKKEDNGTYKCEAKRHDEAKNEIIELIVNYPPEGLYFKEKAVAGESFTISYETNGHPLPNYTIIHNDTKVVSNDKTYTIHVVQYSDAGLYKCIAKNKLGTSSKIYHLSIIAKTGANKQDDGTTVVVWHIIVTLVSGIIIGIVFSYIVWCSHRRWFRNKKPERNSEPRANEVDTTYQELDLSKMNKEDNYQSLRVNAASNGDDATYTELNKTRDEEDNYQSLT